MPEKVQTTVTVPIDTRSRRGLPGIGCCCCKCYCCLNIEFLKTLPGLLKMAEIIFGMILIYSPSVIENTQEYFKYTRYPWSLVTTTFLLFCYVVSPKSLNLIKSSVFETLFNGITAVRYLSVCSFIWYGLSFVLPGIVIEFFGTSPLWGKEYFLGTLLGVIYAFDAYHSYRYFKR